MIAAELLEAIIHDARLQHSGRVNMAKSSFLSKIPNLTNEELVRMIDPSRSDEYEIEAIEAAFAELSSRKIGDHEVEKLATENLYNDRILSESLDSSLTLAGILFFFVFGTILVISVPLAINLKMQGYRKKSEEAFACIFYGIAAWALFLGLAAWISG